MNKRRLSRIATWLEKGAKHKYMSFDMTKGIVFKNEDFKPDDVAHCGTSCCIAGAAVHFYDEVQLLVDSDLQESFNGYSFIDWEYVRNSAKRILGLTDEQCDKLFTPQDYYGDHYCELFGTEPRLAFFNHPQWAARTIRHLIETGEVDWAATYQPEQHG